MEEDALSDFPCPTNNYVLVGLCLYLFFGGVSTNVQAQTTYDIPITAADSIEQTCEKNPRLSGAKTSLKDVQIQTGEQIDFFIPDLNGATTSYILSASLKTSALILNIANESFHVGRRGEIIKTITEKSYEARPISSAILHALTLGLFFITSPINSTQSMIGCTDQKVKSKAVDISKSIPTNLVKWEASRAAHKIRLSGLGSQDVLYIEVVGPSNNIDLSELIAKAAIEGPFELTVECLSCKVNEKDTVARQLPLSNKVVLNVRLEVLAQRAREQAEKILAESVLKQQEEEKRTALLEEQRLARAGDGSPDDEACKKRKLQPTTEPYLKCRSDLVGAREKQEALQLAAEEKKRRAEAARVEKQKLIADAEEAARVATARQVEEKKQKQELASGASVSLGQAGRSSLDASKQKCTELGFKPATEGYGKCVLQLSK